MTHRSSTSPPPIIQSARHGLLQCTTPLGMGAHGVVWRVKPLATRNTPAQRLACKIAVSLPPHGPHDRNSLNAEAHFLRATRHPHIVRTFDNGYVSPLAEWLLLGEIPGDSLDYIASRFFPLPIADCCTIGLQLAEAIHHTHSQGILHRDINPKNIIVQSFLGQVVRATLCDFGLACFLDNTSRLLQTPRVGHAGYIAPELLDGHAASEASDCYALGACLYLMITGTRPFAHISSALLLSSALLPKPRILPDHYRQPPLPASLRTTIEDMMAPEPLERPTLPEAMTELQRHI